MVKAYQRPANTGGCHPRLSSQRGVKPISPPRRNYPMSARPHPPSNPASLITHPKGDTPILHRVVSKVSFLSSGSTTCGESLPASGQHRGLPPTSIKPKRSKAYITTSKKLPDVCASTPSLPMILDIRAHLFLEFQRLTTTVGQSSSMSARRRPRHFNDNMLVSGRT